MELEKQYLSWSRYSLWQTSKRSFWKSYGLGQKVHSKYFNKGNELSNLMEYGDTSSDDELITLMKELVPKLDIAEDKFDVDLQHGASTVKMFGYIDSNSITNEEFLEYKTGKIPWTEEKVKKHEQLDFYAVAMWVRSGYTIIPKAKLVWVETQENEDGSLTYTGNVVIFERKFTKAKLNSMIRKIVKTWDEIKEFEYKELELEKEFVDKYISLKAKQKEIEDELEIMKLDVEVRMQEDDYIGAGTDAGYFSITKRSSWSYSEEFTERAKEVRKLLARAQKEEQENGLAERTYTKSLVFRTIN